MDQTNHTQETRAESLFNEHRKKLYLQTDKLFVVLLLIEWVVAIIASLVITPLAWEGSKHYLHIHVIMAVVAGGALSLFPAALVFARPGTSATRHVIAISQMLFSTLFIHLTGGRIETHFHVFGSLALLAFYRDWRVLISASLAVAIDHLTRGIFLPQSIFGISFSSPLRVLEHVAWVVLEVAFLIKGIAESVKDMREMSVQAAKLQETNETIERTVAERTETLRKTERESRRLACLVQQSGDAIVCMGLDGTVLSWNSGAEKLYSYTASEMIGTKYGPNLPKDVLKAHALLLRRAAKGHSIEGHETLTVTKSGKVVDIATTLSPVRDDDDKIVAVSVIIRDITERKLVEKRMSEFYSVISHELRTPLTSIKGALALIAEGIVEQGTDEATELINIAQKSSSRLIRLINDILDIRKIEAGRFELNLIEKSAKALVENAVSAMTGFAEEKKVHLLASIDEDFQVRVDDDRITQVLSNLISNAVKYAPLGSTVTVKAKKSGKTGQFSILDNGPGISSEDQGKLFAKFKQIDSSDTRAKEGSGLGLAISKAIVEQHGGKIGLVSSPGVETEFWFTVPLASQAEPKPAQPVVHEGGNELESRVSGLDSRPSALGSSAVKNKILIVEDDYELSCLLQLNLERQNYECRQALTMEQANEFLQDEMPDALILDLGLPDGNGLEILKKLHKANNSDSPAIPVIIISGSDIGTSTANIQSNVFDWLQKPFSQSTLSESVARALTASSDRKKVLVDDDNSLIEELNRLKIDFIGSDDFVQSGSTQDVQDLDLIVFNETCLQPGEPTKSISQLRGRWSEFVPIIVYSAYADDSCERSTNSVSISRHVRNDNQEPNFITRVESVLFRLLDEPN